MSDTRIVLLPITWSIKHLIREVHRYNGCDPYTAVDWEECLLALIHASEYISIPYSMFLNASLKERKCILEDLKSHASTGIYEMIIEPGYDGSPDDPDAEFGSTYYEDLDNSYNEILDEILRSDYFAGLYLFIEDVIDIRRKREDVLRVFASERRIGVRYG